MGFTQVHANQNKAMVARATTLLNERGYHPSLETTDDNGRLIGPQWQIIQDVIKDVAAEFDDIAFSRVQHQVHGVCARARGRLWRERRNQ